MTSIKRLSVSAEGCHLQGGFKNREERPKSLIKALHCPYWKDENTEVLRELKFYNFNIFVIPIRAISY
jgi:LEA14-like dessication related protein